jgi:hypothetical protein
MLHDWGGFQHQLINSVIFSYVLGVQQISLLWDLGLLSFRGYMKKCHKGTKTQNPH